MNEGSCFKHGVNPTIYSKEAILETCYRLNKNHSVVLDKYDPNEAEVLISNYDSDEQLKVIISDFNRELSDQQLRHQISKETLNIKTLIVAEAFSPLAELKDLEGSDT